MSLKILHEGTIKFSYFFPFFSLAGRVSSLFTIWITHCLFSHIWLSEQYCVSINCILNLNIQFPYPGSFYLMNLNDSIKHVTLSFFLIILRTLEENWDHFVPIDLRLRWKVIFHRFLILYRSSCKKKQNNQEFLSHLAKKNVSGEFYIVY